MAACKQAVELSELGLRELLTSQDHALFKKRKLKARMKLFRLAGQSVPAYGQRLLPPIRADYVNAMKLYAARYVLSGNHRILRRLFRRVRTPRRVVPQTRITPVKVTSQR